MKIRLGDFFRSVVPKEWKWVRRALEIVKGVTIRVRGHDILLDKKHTPEIRIAKKLTAEERERFSKDWRDAHRGP